MCEKLVTNDHRCVAIMSQMCHRYTADVPQTRHRRVKQNVTRVRQYVAEFWCPPEWWVASCNLPATQLNPWEKQAASQFRADGKHPQEICDLRRSKVTFGVFQETYTVRNDCKNKLQNSGFIWVSAAHQHQRLCTNQTYQILCFFCQVGLFMVSIILEVATWGGVKETQAADATFRNVFILIYSRERLSAGFF